MNTNLSLQYILYFINPSKISNRFINKYSKIIYLTLLLLIVVQSKVKLLYKNINVAYGLNDQNTYPTLVSMISILENASHYTLYTFYLLIGKGLFKKENKAKILHLEEKYNRCKVIFLEITNDRFVNANTKRYPIATYYRLLLPELIEHANRIIYLDGDTLVFTDLSEMINLQMKNNIILGFVDDSYKKAKKFHINTYKYITCGVLLMNLKKMRKEKISQKFFDFIFLNKNKLSQEDQTVINIVLNGRIGLLPPKFGIWDFASRRALISHNNYKNKSLSITAYNENEMIMAWKAPSILHFVRVKPWKNVTKKKILKKFKEKWWEYARKSDEYYNILKCYSNI